MTQEDTNYFRQRAEAELQLAQKAVLPEVMAVHYRLADAYLERISQNDPFRPAEDI